MASIFDVAPGELIAKTAEELKKMKEMQPPAWAKFVKTGSHRERPPINKDWWHIRAAAMLRKLAIKGPIGVSKLRTEYGGKKQRGTKPNITRRSSGNIIRKILQQLEKAGLSKQDKRGVHKGRVITPKGISLLDKLATQITKK
jgi:small subunit ribosomal protein S19e